MLHSNDRSSPRERLNLLRQQLANKLAENSLPAGLSRRSTMRAATSALPLGLAVIDTHLGGGLARGSLHEIAGAGNDAELATLPAFFASQLIQRHAGQRVIWVALKSDLYGPGLQAQGIDPGRLLLVETRQDAEALWVLEEAARSGAVPFIIGEIDHLDLTASRRLQLAAEENGSTILVLRRSHLISKGEKHRNPSAATTRWQIVPLPSRIIGDRPGLGCPCWHLHLWRQRNGPPGQWDITLQGNTWHHTQAEPRGNSAKAANDDTKNSSTNRHIASPG